MLPDWNNDKAKPPKAWSPCSPTQLSIDKQHQARQKNEDVGATVANSLKK